MRGSRGRFSPRRSGGLFPLVNSLSFPGFFCEAENALIFYGRQDTHHAIQKPEDGFLPLGTPALPPGFAGVMRRAHYGQTEGESY